MAADENNQITFPFRQTFATIPLTATQRTILEERYFRLLERAHSRCRQLSLLFNSNRGIVTIASILVPALLSIQYTNDPFGHTFTIALYWTTWVMSLFVTFSNGMLTMFKLDRKYYLVHAAYEQLKTEGWQYAALVGHYQQDELAPGANSPMAMAMAYEREFKRFCATIERIRMRQMEEEYVRLQDSSRPPPAAASATTGATAIPAGSVPAVFQYAHTPARDDLLGQVIATTGRKAPGTPKIPDVESGNASEEASNTTSKTATSPQER